MAELTNRYLDDSWTAHAMWRATRARILERMDDPYMTDYDLWVLDQFARFLRGVAPGPDLRMTTDRARQG